MLVAATLAAGLSILLTGLIAPGSSEASLGTATPWIEVASNAGDVAVHGSNTYGTIGYISLPVGSYLVTAKVDVNNTSASETRVACLLLPNGPSSTKGLDASAVTIPAHTITSGLVDETMSLVAAATLHTSTKVTLRCGATGSAGAVNADYIVITATRAGQLVKGSLHVG
jgi:hypothetical protein